MAKVKENLWVEPELEPEHQLEPELEPEHQLEPELENNKMKEEELTVSRFLTKIDVTPAVLLTVSHSLREKVGEEEEIKCVTWFKEVEKPMVMNKTNRSILFAGFNCDDTDDWVGKQIVVYYANDVQFKGKTTGGIRVRLPKSETATPDDTPF